MGGGVSIPSPHSPCPFGSSLWICPQEKGGRGEGGGRKPSGSEPRRCRGGGFPCKGFAAQPQPGWVGQEGTSLSQGVKTLLPFPAASDGLTPLPGITTRMVPLPSLGSGGDVCVRASHPPSFLGRI